MSDLRKLSEGAGWVGVISLCIFYSLMKIEWSEDLAGSGDCNQVLLQASQMSVFKFLFNDMFCSK